MSSRLAVSSVALTLVAALGVSLLLSGRGKEPPVARNVEPQTQETTEDVELVPIPREERTAEGQEPTPAVAAKSPAPAREPTASPVPKPDFVIEGLVQWIDGRPIKGARVELDDQSGRNRDRTVRTRADGSFRTRCAHAGPYRVTVYADTDPDARRPQRNFARTTRENIYAPHKNLLFEVHTGHSVTGRVVDEAGNPVTRFMLMAIDFDEPSNAGTVSKSFDSPTGDFELNGLTEATWMITAQAVGHADSEMTPAEVPTSPPIELRVHRTGRVRGKVVDSSGDPVARAEMRSEWRDGVRVIRESLSKPFVTDQQGRFQINVRSGDVTVWAESDGLVSRSVDLTLAPNATEEGLVLIMPLAGRIAGTISSAVGEVTGRQVSLWSEDDRTKDRVEADASGAFTFDGLAPGWYTLQLDTGPDMLNDLRDFYPSSMSVEVSAGLTTHAVLGSPTGGSVIVHGRVTKSGRGVPDLAILVDSKRTESSTTTDQEGNYELRVEPPGPLWIGAGNSMSSFVHKEVDLPVGTDRLEVNFDLAPNSMAGSVLTADGTPVRDEVSVVHLSAGDVFSERIASTDGEGRFSMASVPAGKYMLIAGPVHREDGSISAGITWMDIEISNDTQVSDIVLRLPRPTRIFGDVRTPAGRVCTRTVVEVLHPNGAPVTPWPLARTDFRGDYECAGLPEGSYRLRARGQSKTGPETRVDVSAGGEYQVDLILDE